MDIGVAVEGPQAQERGYGIPPIMARKTMAPKAGIHAHRPVCRASSPTMRPARGSGGTPVPSIAWVLLLASPLSPGFLRNEDDEPGELRRRKIGNAAGGDGHDTIWSRFF